MFFLLIYLDWRDLVSDPIYGYNLHRLNFYIPDIKKYSNIYHESKLSKNDDVEDDIDVVALGIFNILKNLFFSN